MPNLPPFSLSRSFSLLLGAIAWISSGCSATGSGTDGTGGKSSSFVGPSGSGSNSGSGSGASTGSIVIFGTGATLTGGVNVCTDPDCIGNTPQGMCDSEVPLDNPDGFKGAYAMGLCKLYEPGSWGIKSAEYIRSNGAPLTGTGSKPRSLGRGNLSSFGPLAPREGARMLALSTGTARDPDDPGYLSPSGVARESSPESDTPDGFPKPSPSCPSVTAGNPYDSAGLKLVIKTPRDAKSIKFNLNFYTYEFPGYICSRYNDFFVALMEPKPVDAPDGNIAFDIDHNNISVNSGLLQVCKAQTAGGKPFACPNGIGELAGTGFENHAATGWLETSVPIANPGEEITLTFLVWDSGDASLDSTILFDNFRFELTDAPTGTVVVPP